MGVWEQCHAIIDYRKSAFPLSSTTTTVATTTLRCLPHPTAYVPLRTDDYHHYRATTTDLQLRTDAYDHYSPTTTDLRHTSYVYGLASMPLVLPTVDSLLPQTRDSQVTLQQLRYHSFYNCSRYARSCLKHSTGDRNCYNQCDCDYYRCDSSRSDHRCLRIAASPLELISSRAVS